ncbi:PDZ and LIM domain protein Zasp [Trachymyrmex septentrionalis]|uniref:PDZ and LIM domain protein Zasp n=1 Tax=Trachymyrmex septentrionalis TaxID=34720 RepID=A0A195F284_9HYME|nr:PDZ and LIM domain protein Zasp [Trachymyrmex septentrionalis]
MTRRHTLIVKLKRSSTGRPWGIRIAGGADLGTPIVVTRSENEALQKGDIIKKIDDYDARDVRHVDAQNLLQNSETIKLVIERSEPSRVSSRTSTDTTITTSSSPPTFRPIVGNGAAATSLYKQPKEYPQELPKSPIRPPSVEEYRSTPTPEYTLRSTIIMPHEHLDEIREERVHLSQVGGCEGSPLRGTPLGDEKMPAYTTVYRYNIEHHPKEEEAAVYWPYRTTPLVLPGAKVKKDAPIGECYLRHHPNPMIRAAPHHYEPAHPEVAMKQKVAETVLQRVVGPNEVPKIVHKQFNSPIGLYSDQNIADTIKCQASAVPLKKPVKYDPSKSEAYKALQEEEYGDQVQEVRQPARTGVFTPQKSSRMYQAPPKSPAYINVLDDDGEKIHQSNSFKRIMYSVLGQTEF